MPIARVKQQLMVKATRKDGWTKARRTRFLEVLAATCNATKAAKAAGIDRSNALKLRRRDPEFAGLWAAAIAAGTERLREEVLAHSLGQLGDDENPDADVVDAGDAPTFDAKLAIDALKTVAALETRGSGPRAGPVYASEAEVARLLGERLDALAKRLGDA